MGAAAQNAIALAVVMLAAMSLAYRSVKAFASKKSTGCGSCSACPSSTQQPGIQVLSIGKLVK